MIKNNSQQQQLIIKENKNNLTLLNNKKFKKNYKCEDINCEINNKLRRNRTTFTTRQVFINFKIKNN
jgi:hypothetical protein